MTGVYPHRHTCQPRRDPCRQRTVTMHCVGAALLDNSHIFRHSPRLKGAVRPVAAFYDLIPQPPHPRRKLATSRQDHLYIKPLTVTIFQLAQQQHPRSAYVGVGKNVKNPFHFWPPFFIYYGPFLPFNTKKQSPTALSFENAVGLFLHYPCGIIKL